MDPLLKKRTWQASRLNLRRRVMILSCNSKHTEEHENRLSDRARDRARVRVKQDEKMNTKTIAATRASETRHGLEKRRDGGGHNDKRECRTKGQQTLEREGGDAKTTTGRRVFEAQETSPERY